MKSQLIITVLVLFLATLSFGASSSSSSTCTKGNDAPCLSTCGPTCCCLYLKVSAMGMNVESYGCAPNPSKHAGSNLSDYSSVMNMGGAMGGSMNHTGMSIDSVSYCANSNLLVSSVVVLFSVMSLYILG